jgi:TP901 family phage tail tape measure protein
MAINVPIITSFDAKGINKAIVDFKRLEGGALKAGFALRTLDQGAAAVARAFAKVGMGAAVVGGLAVKQFASFDDAMTQSTAIMGDVSDQMRTQMSDAARQMAKQTTFSATQAAESFYFLASAGLDAESSITALPKVAQFAQAGMFDMARATDLLTDAQSALGLTIRDDAVANMENMVRVSDVLVKANTLANASVEQFSTALTNKAGAAMKSVGMDIEEGVAVLAAFADQGIKAEEAGTQFGIVLRDLQTKAIDNKDEFKALNVSVFDSRGELRNMADIVSDLEKALRGQSDETKKAALQFLGFSDKSVSALTALLGTSDAIRRYEGDLRNAAGTTDEVANKQLESLSSQLKIAWNRIQDVAITLGEQLAPIVLKMADFITGLVDTIGERGLGGALEYVAGKFASFYSNLGTLGKIIVGLVGSFVLLRTTVTIFNGLMVLGNIAVQTFGVSLSTVSGLALGFSAAFTGIIAAAGLIYSVYAKSKQEAAAATKGFTEALKLEGEAQNEALVALANSNDDARAVLDSMELLGYSFDDLRQYVKEGTGELANLTREWDAHIRHLGGTQRVYAATYELISGVTLAGDDLLEKYANMTQEQKNLAMAFSNVLGPELVRLRDSELKLAASSQLVAGLLDDVGDSAKRSGDLIAYGTAQYSRLAQMYRERLPNPFASIVFDPEPVRSFGGVVRSAAERLQDYIDALRSWERQTLSVEDAQQSLIDAQNAQIDATQAVADAQTYYNKVLRGFSKDSKEVIDAQQKMADAQLRYRDAQLRTRDAQESLIEAQKRYQALTEPADARSVQEATDKVTEAQFRLTDAQAELAKLERRRIPNARLLAQAQIAVREATWSLSDAQAELTDLQDGASEEELSDAQRDIEDATRNLEDAQRTELESIKNLADAQKDLNELVNGAAEDSERYRDAVDRLKNAKQQEADAIDAVADAMRNQRDATYELTQAEQQLSQSRSQVRGDLLKADIAAFERTGIISPALAQAFAGIDWNALGKAGQIPGKADGGTVAMNRPYIVGERGPELFVPEKTGTIIPNHAMTGTTNIVVNVSGSVTSEKDLVEKIRKGLVNAQRSGRTLIPT